MTTENKPVVLTEGPSLDRLLDAFKHALENETEPRKVTFLARKDTSLQFGATIHYHSHVAPLYAQILGLRYVDDSGSNVVIHACISDDSAASSRVDIAYDTERRTGQIRLPWPSHP